MSDPSRRPSKRAKTSNSKPAQAPMPKRTLEELINAIPPPPHYEPLPHREVQRPPAIQLPSDTNADPYGLFTLFLTESESEMIARNTNRYAEIKGAASDGKRTWWPTKCSRD